MGIYGQVVKVSKRRPVTIIHGHAIYPATFRGKHNSTKGRALLLLWIWKHIQHRRKGLPCRKLAIYSRCGIASVFTGVTKWTKWGYIERKLCKVGNQQLYTYRLAEKGERFCKRMPVEVRVRLLRSMDFAGDIV